MDAEFWLGRWQQGQIGWHQSQAHGMLEKFWPSLDIARDARVFVPLCGKSLDMRWLRERGHAVVGIDLSPLAAQSYFAEIGVRPEIDRVGALQRWRGAGYEFWVGDFFALRSADLGTVDAFYDRAAMIALPPPERDRYRRHLAGLVPAGSRGLLITLEYDETLVQGPPFCVVSGELTNGLHRDFDIVELDRTTSTPDNPRFRDASVTTWTEVAHRLCRRAPA